MALTTSPKCLLCGYHPWPDNPDDKPEDSGIACDYCKVKALTLEPKEIKALLSIDQLKMEFEIRSKGQRVLSDDKCPVKQPAQIFSEWPFFIGDIDDACDLEKLEKLNVKGVINLCADKLKQKEYRHLAGALANASIDFMVLNADDSYNFEIVPVAEKTFAFINSFLCQNYGVLVHCYAGVNRSGAVAAAYLVREQNVPLVKVIAQLRQTRGTVLTNQSFCLQLVKYCSQNGLQLEGDDVVTSSDTKDPEY